MEMLKWMWRGLLRRLGMMAAEIPPPPDQRPEVAERLQVEPIEEHPLPPGVANPTEPAPEAQQHPHPAERRGSMQN